jgi:hypothetical protein
MSSIVAAVGRLTVFEIAPDQQRAQMGIAKAQRAEVV